MFRAILMLSRCFFAMELTLTRLTGWATHHSTLPPAQTTYPWSHSYSGDCLKLSQVRNQVNSFVSEPELLSQHLITTEGHRSNLLKAN